MREAGFIRKKGRKDGLLMTEHFKGEVCYLTFPLLDRLKGFTNGFSTRLGGVSTGIFSSMNLSSNRGDDKEKVLENYRRLAGAAGFSVASVVASKQTHTTNIRIVTKKDLGMGMSQSWGAEDEIDGLVTNEPDITLMTFYADCVPLYFIDPVHRAIGLSHSGWRGTVNKMGLKTVTLMQETFGSDPKELYAAIGPSICMDCYEVSEDVAQAFREAFPEEIAELVLREKGGGKYLLDLWESNRQLMLMAGIPENQIEVTDICTCCNPRLLFSHRASNGKRGNLAGFLRIEP